MPGYNNICDVDKETVQELRARFEEELEKNDPDAYHSEDIARVKEDNWFVMRYALHQNKNVDNALKMLEESLKFRKEYKANCFTKEEIPDLFFTIRPMFIYNHDKDGHPLVVVRTKVCRKDPKIKIPERLYTVNWIEKALRKSNWGSIVLLFDCTDIGISNMHFDMVQFLFNMFGKYYPCSLASVMIYNCPLCFRGFWKVLKVFIPERYENKVHFVNKETIQDFVNLDQLPVIMGGTCTKIYDPENETDAIPDDDQCTHHPEQEGEKI